jgi:hypothetical protein
MFTTEIRVGRLYEHRIVSLDSEEDIVAVGMKAGEVMARSREQVVVCADYRQLRFLKQELTEQFIERIGRLNDRIERSAVLITNDQAIFNLQMARMIRRMNYPNRRLFHDPKELQVWLGEVLTPPERLRLAAFLANASLAAELMTPRGS